MIPQATLDNYSAEQVEIKSRSGNLAYVVKDGAELSISTLFCTCPDVEFALYRTGRETVGDWQAVYVCLSHGTHTTAAMRCGNPAVRGPVQISTSAAGRVFGYSEQMARLRAKKSQAPQWGFASGGRLPSAESSQDEQ